MTETRNAETRDEAWMIEKLNQRDQDIERFRPRDFLVAYDEDTEERLAFGRTEFVRNVDDIEYVTITDTLFLGSADDLDKQRLVVDLVDTLSDQEQVFAFPISDKEVFESVGFNETTSLPDVLESQYEDRKQAYGEDVVALTAVPSQIEVEDTDDEDDEKEVHKEEMERLKDEFDSEDTTTKYSV